MIRESERTTRSDGLSESSRAASPRERDGSARLVRARAGRPRSVFYARRSTSNMLAAYNAGITRGVKPGVTTRAPVARWLERANGLGVAPGPSAATRWPPDHVPRQPPRQTLRCTPASAITSPITGAERFALCRLDFPARQCDLRDPAGRRCPHQAERRAVTARQDCEHRFTSRAAIE